MINTKIKILILLITGILFSLTRLAGNENDNYIAKEIAKLDKYLEKCKFVSGEVYFENDTLSTDILLFRKKDKTNKFLFIVTRSYPNDSIKIFKANDVLGYRADDEFYLKLIRNEEQFFIQKIKSGLVDLYARERIPSDNKFLYYLARSNAQNYYIINPYENNIKEYDLPNPMSDNKRTGTITYIEDQGINKKFKEFIAVFMWDCLRVRNMVQSEFYTISSIPSIVDVYNNCSDAN